MTAEFTVQDAPGLLPCTFENFVWLSSAGIDGGTAIPVATLQRVRTAGRNNA